jgi:hypothetical protein
VPALPVPQAGADTDAAAAQAYASVRLFAERAHAAAPGFELTDGNAAAVAEICRRLDGLPLAIELAAAKVRLLPPQALLARLSDRMGLLTGGARDLPERQQALRNTLDWSFGLLAPAEQALFAENDELAGYERVQREQAAALAYNYLGQARLSKEDPGAAARLFTQALTAARQAPDRMPILISLYDLALSSQAQGDLTAAAEHLTEGLSLAAEAGDQTSAAYYLEALAAVASLTPVSRMSSMS